MTDLQSLALAGAQGGAEGVAELIRWHREGGCTIEGPVSDSALTGLADALTVALLIRIDANPQPSDREAIGQLLAALRKFEADFQ